MRSQELSAALAQKPDCAVICTDHTAFDYEALVKSGTLIVDTRNALRGVKGGSIFRL
jgi:UDP-N-acetyl-D-glucosamine dehydrogenase